MGRNEIIILGSNEQSWDETLVNVLDWLYFIEIKLSFTFNSPFYNLKDDSEEESRDLFGVLSEQLLR